jgi:16S rRNA (guanine527-N7)-methyltransferase
MITEQFVLQAKQMNITITKTMQEQFEYYYKKLVEYNKKVNLTAITEKQEVYIKHFLDSIVIASELRQNATLVDVGTGAGFPSLPLKIVRPDLRVVMVDSLNKRVVFLQELIKELNLNNITAVHARAEDFVKTNREQFETIVARAVASLNTLSEYCLPFVKVGGFFYAYKSSHVEEELNGADAAIKLLGGVVVQKKSVTLPQTQIERSIVIIKKVKSTPKQYPRDKNRAKTQPL